MSVRRNTLILLVLAVALIGAKPAVPPGLEHLPHADLVAQATPEQPRGFSTMRASAQEPQPVIVTLKEPEAVKQLRPAAQRMRAHDRQQLKETMREFAIHENKKQPKHKYATFNSYALELTPSEIKQLENNPLVESVQASLKVDAFLDESVPLINASSAWALKTNGENLTGTGTAVCIIDTGVDYTHAALGGCTQEQFLNGTCEKIPGGHDFVNNDSDPVDDEGHGTHVAGIAAANGSVTGVAPGARIVAVKALDSGGSGNLDDIAAGIDWCTSNKDTYNITSIGMSLGTSCADGNCFSDTCDSASTGMTDAINAATQAGISVAAATGNEQNKTHISLPACITNATAVASSTKSDAISSFSNRNNLSPIVAPGSSITSTKNGGGLEIKSGTSMATPHVAGAMAILHQQALLAGYNRTPAQIEQALENTGKRINDSQSNLSYSRIDVYAAVDSPSTIAQFPAGWQNAPFNVTLNATSENSEIQQTAYRLNNGSERNGTQVRINNSGNHTLEFYSVDADGNKEDNKTAHPLLDLLSPTTVDNATSSWNKPPFTIFLNATDTLSGINYTSYRVDGGNWTNNDTAVISSSGNLTLEYFSVDVAGNQENSSNVSVLADADAPSLSISNESGWQNADFVVNWSAIDAHSGVNRTRFRIDGGAWSNASNHSVNSSGNFTLTISALDEVGNENSTSVSALLDKVDPLTSDDAPSGWQNANVTISLNASDNLSGINHTSYRVGGGNWTNNSVINFTTDGNFSVEYFSVDVAGNQESTRNASVAVDQTAPSLNVSAASGWQNQSFTVSFSPLDATSGVENYFIVRGNESFNSTNVTISSEGNTSVTFSATDKANNTNATVRQVLLDLTAPATTTDAPSGWQTSNVTLVFNASDNLSGVNHTSYRIDGGSWINSSNASLSDGNHSVEYFSADRAGNQEAVSNVSVLVDTIAPSIKNFTRNQTSPGVNESVLFSAIISDNTTLDVTITINQTHNTTQNNTTYSYNHSFAQPGNYDVTVSASDQAGHQANKTLQVTVYEKEQHTNHTVNDTVFDARNQTRTKLRLKTNATIQANLTLLRSKATPAGINKSLARALTHTTVELSQNAKDALEWALLTLTYEDDELGSLDEDSLRMAYYNESAGQWVNLTSSLGFVHDAGVDASSNEVWANVTHFSTYAITGDEKQEQEEDTGSSSSGGSSSGGGGGGGGFAAPQSNNSSTLTFTFLSAGNPVSKTLNNDQLQLTKITFTPVQDAISAQATVTRKPVPADAPQHAVHYFEISHPGLEATDVTLEFRHEATGAVALHRDADGWQQLPTKQLEQGVYQATSPGLSRFAITDEPTSQATPQPEEEPQEQNQTQPTPEPQPDNTTEQPAEKAETPPVPLELKILLYALASLIVLTVIAAVFPGTWHKRER